MPQDSPAPRRHRSSFRAPAPGSVDPQAVARLFGAEGAAFASTAPDRTAPSGDATVERMPRAEAEPSGHTSEPAVERPRPTALPAETATPVEAVTSSDVAEDAPKHRAGRPRNRRASRAPSPASRPPRAIRGDAQGGSRLAPDVVAPMTGDAGSAADVPVPAAAMLETRTMPAAASAAQSAPGGGSGEPDRHADTVTFDTLLAAGDESPAGGTPRRRPRRVVLAAASVALAGAAGFGAVVATGAFPGADSGGTSSASDDVSTSATPAVTSGLSETAAPFTGGTSVTVAGEHLDDVAQVAVGGTPATIVEAASDHLTFTVPATSGDAIGDVDVVFTDAQGQPVDVTVDGADAGAPAEASTDAPAATDATGAPAATGASADALTLTYTSDPAIDAQLAYVLEHWSDYNTAEYPAVRGADAVNFASQALIARGWTMDDAWYVDAETGAMSAAWSSSTALREYLLTRADRATELTDAQRDQVKVGDLAQFDWDDSGDRDHTAIVTRVEHTGTGTTIAVASHTKDADYWDVDAALAAGGGSVSWFSIR